MSTPRDTTTTDALVSRPAGVLPVELLVEWLSYVCALIADQPRAIDRYIDYFGEPRPIARKALANTPSSAVASGLIPPSKAAGSAPR